MGLFNFRSLEILKAPTHTFISSSMLRSLIKLHLIISVKNNFPMLSKFWCSQTPIFQFFIINAFHSLTHQIIRHRISYNLLAQHFSWRFLVRAAYHFLSLQQHFLSISWANHIQLTRFLHITALNIYWKYTLFVQVLQLTVMVSQLTVFFLNKIVLLCSNPPSII